MTKKAATPEAAYGTKLEFKKMRSNHPVKSRYMAATLAIIFGIVGANQFYLRNFVRGILKLVFTFFVFLFDLLFNPPLILIPVVISILTGLMYLLQSDTTFARKNHVRTI